MTAILVSVCVTAIAVAALRSHDTTPNRLIDRVSDWLDSPTTINAPQVVAGGFVLLILAVSFTIGQIQ